LGGIIGGGIDIASTRVIGYNAYKIFMKGETPSVDDLEKEIPIEAEIIEVQDIDTQTLEEAMKHNITPDNIQES